MKKILISATALVQLATATVRADEGMWLPMLISRLNYTDMQKHGLQLTAEEIYSVNNSSLKDAIVALNGGSCTAEMISDQGLLLTNHHCAFGVIQDNSTVEHDYLTNGFWAMAMKDELPARNMTASYLIEMRDVTNEMLKNVSLSLSGEERTAALDAVQADIVKRVTDEFEGRYTVEVKPFFEGNEYYLFVYEIFRDLRLVGAPPSAIGKFGGDTDNWMWPRHTGDFSMMRVYESPDGKPADYSESNRPHKPKHSLPISLAGTDKNDFAMIMGYPGSTDRFLSSYGVLQELEHRQPAIVSIREKRLALMKEDMDADAATRIKYASKYAQISNYYKYFIGQQRGLKRLKVYDKKKALENDFERWVAADGERQKIYGNVIADWTAGYADENKSIAFMTYFGECIFGSEATLNAWRANRLYGMLAAGADVSAEIEGMRSRSAKFFQDYNRPTDEKISAAMFEMMNTQVPQDQLVESFKSAIAKSKGDYKAMVSKLYAKSMFCDQTKFNAFLDNPTNKALDADPLYKLATDFITAYRAMLSGPSGLASEKIQNSNRLFVNALRQMNSNKVYAPNANSTMRVTYGNVLDYFPADAVHYDHFTTIDGIMEKEDPKNDEFIVPQKLKDLYKAKDYGQYGENGTLQVCFLANTDITGGNSGSPVINGRGELIGCAFDGNWEAMSGDIAFEPELQRTIAVDIRYVLFIVDKYAGAKNIINELKLVSASAKTDASIDNTPTAPAKANDRVAPVKM